MSNLRNDFIRASRLQFKAKIFFLSKSFFRASSCSKGVSPTMFIPIEFLYQIGSPFQKYFVEVVYVQNLTLCCASKQPRNSGGWRGQKNGVRVSEIFGTTRYSRSVVIWIL